jgi:hypothetical protein
MKREARAMKKIEAGWYENDTHRIFKTSHTEWVTTAYKRHDSINSKVVSDWCVLNKINGNLVRGMGSKKQAILLSPTV